MDRASSSSAPDLAEDFQQSIVADLKRKLEDSVLEKTLSTWSKPQELQFNRELGFSRGGPTAIRKLVVLEKKYQRRLGVPHVADIFNDECVYFLMLFKEQKVLRRIAFSDDFLKTCTGGMVTGWVYGEQQ